MVGHCILQYFWNGDSNIVVVPDILGNWHDCTEFIELKTYYNLNKPHLISPMYS